MLFIFSITCTLVASAKEEPAKVVTEKPMELKVVTFDYPPFMQATPVEGHKGLEIEIFEAALKGLPSHVTYDFFPIQRAVLTYSKDTTREPSLYIGTSVHFKKEIASGEFAHLHIGHAQFVAYVRKSSPLSRKKQITMKDLKKIQVAALRGSSVVKALTDSRIEPMQTHSFKQLFNVVDSGRVDTSIVLDIAGDQFLDQNQDKLKNKIVKLKSDIYQIPLDIVIAKNHPQFKALYEHMKSRLTQMRKDGELKQIAQYYYGKMPVPPEFLEAGE